MSSINEINIRLKVSNNQYHLTDRNNNETRTPSIIATPPVRGVNLVCKERWLGLSKAIFAIGVFNIKIVTSMLIKKGINKY